MSDMKIYEYIWLDGYQPEPSLRSKIKVTKDDTPPEWSFDGSSTQQAEGGSSDCLILPVQTSLSTSKPPTHWTHLSPFHSHCISILKWPERC